MAAKWWSVSLRWANATRASPAHTHARKRSRPSPVVPEERALALHWAGGCRGSAQRCVGAPGQCARSELGQPSRGAGGAPPQEAHAHAMHMPCTCGCPRTWLKGCLAPGWLGPGASAGGGGAYAGMRIACMHMRHVAMEVEKRSDKNLKPPRCCLHRHARTGGGGSGAGGGGGGGGPNGGGACGRSGHACCAGYPLPRRA